MTNSPPTQLSLMNKSQATSTLKISFNDEIFKTSKPANLKNLLAVIREIYPSLSKHFSLKYEDTEGDKVVIATEEDYQIAVAIFESEGKTLKVYITEKDVPESTSEITRASKRDEVTIEEEKPEIQEILTTKEVPADEPQKPAADPKEEAIPFEEDGNLAKFKEIARQTLQEEIPTIAMIVKQLLEENSEQQPRKQREEFDGKSSKAIHHGVACDVCGVCPIIGDRYKCTVRYDYDLCSSCEAKVDHPYPLLKFKNEAQSAIKVVTMLPPHQEAPHFNAHRCRGFSGERTQQRPRPCQDIFGSEFQGLKTLFGGLLEQFSKPEENEKLNSAIKNGFEMFQGLVNEFKTQFEAANPNQAQSKENTKEETKEAPAQNNSKDTSEKQGEKIEEKASKKPQDDFNFVGQLCKNLFSEVAQNFGNLHKQEQTEDRKIGEDKEEILRKAKALVEIFPQITIEDVSELVRSFPNKSVEELALDLLASF